MSEFGRLRSFMNTGELSEEDRAQLWALISEVARDDPDEFAQRWRPYMRGFTKHWDRQPLATVCDIEALERALGWCPFALFRMKPDVTLFERIDPLTFFSHPGMQHVVALDLSRHFLEDGDILVLERAPAMSKLEVLDLSHNGLEGRHLSHLIDRARLPRLRRLDVSHNEITLEHVSALSSALASRHVEVLSHALGATTGG